MKFAPWADTLEAEEREWFERWMPEVLALDEATAKRALKTLDIEALKAISREPRSHSVSDLEDAFGRSYSNEDETRPETGSHEAVFTEEDLLAVIAVLEEAEAPALPSSAVPVGTKEKKKRSMRAKIAAVFATALLCIAIGAAGTMFAMYQKGTSYDPSPNQEDAATAKPTASDPYAGFPEVDWGHWQGVNPDIIGWVTVPGTSIDYPIVQERAEAVGFYLNHDAYGDWNYTGVPYLDWECAEKGLDSPNCPIAGHHMQGAEAMFAELVHYNDAGWAKEHREVWIQTPDWKKRLYVQAAGLVPGWEASMVTSFKDRSEWVAWWKVRYEAADVKLSKTARLRQPVYSLYTCSYFVWSSNERTLVYAMEVK